MRPARLTSTNAPANLKRTYYYVGEALLFAIFIGFLIAVGFMAAGK